MSYELGHSAGGFTELLFVTARRCHRYGDGVRCVDDPGFGETVECGSDAVGGGFDELRMWAERGELIDDQAFGAGGGDVFDVLAAAGVGGVGGGCDGQRAADPIVLHLAKGV